MIGMAVAAGAVTVLGPPKQADQLRRNYRVTQTSSFPEIRVALSFRKTR